MYRYFYRQYMQQYRRVINVILDNWPLRKQLGFYAYLPIFFAIGAWTEFTMIHMRINGIDFYSVYMRKERERLAQERKRIEQMLDAKRAELEQQSSSLSSTATTTTTTTSKMVNQS
uniref:Small integral membrane protein 4-like n=1 Tax=Dermatophagoides pteronyssinus TaxID=6956 RepID=A0A6P6YI32_DERPT|nr:small integral membrane protein 4-like [Dermatophagoides pteronyssinus]